MPFSIKALTDRGRKRPHNEDRHAIWVAPASVDRPDPEVLALVADGMGGALSGEIASGMVAEIVLRQFQAAVGEDPAVALSAAFREANERVFEKSEAVEEHRGMGTTCTAVVLRGRRAWLAHVGDSRAYLVRSGVARQLTRDHSLVADLVRRGELSEEQALTDSRRNILTRSLGVGESVLVDVVSLDEDLESGDTVVLCSDGLHGLVAAAEIAAEFGAPDLQGACGRLVDLALDRGGHDNITIVALTMQRDAEAGDGGPGHGEPEPGWGKAEARPAPGAGTRAGGFDDTPEPREPEASRWAEDAYGPDDPLDSLPEFPLPPRRRGRLRTVWVLALAILALIGAALAVRWALSRPHRSGGHARVERALVHAAAFDLGYHAPIRVGRPPLAAGLVIRSSGDALSRGRPRCST